MASLKAYRRGKSPTDDGLVDLIRRAVACPVAR